MSGLREFLTIVFNAFGYAAFGIFILAIIYKTYSLKKTPVPWKIPTGPQSPNLGGVVSRMTQDVVIFRSLAKGETEQILWLAGWLFHVGFLLVVLRHLRYFLYPVPAVIMWLQWLGIAAGIVMFFALWVLFFRRFTNERVFYVSTFADYFVLILIILIVSTGLLMKYAIRPDIVDVKAFVFGLVTFRPTYVPMNALFLVHFSLVMLLLIFFPFSKLMHAVGYFLNPARNQINDPRTRKHKNPWLDQAWQELLSKGTGVIDPETSEPYQPWSVEQWRKRWQKQEN